MFLQWCRDELVLDFIFVQLFCFVGQDLASIRHHCRNTIATLLPIHKLPDLIHKLIGVLPHIATIYPQKGPGF